MTSRTTSNSPGKVLLADYQPPAYLIPEISLSFEIRDRDVAVRSVMTVQRAAHGAENALILQGKDLTLLSVELDGRELKKDRYLQTDEELRLFGVPDECTVTICTRINPFDNKSGMGLYESRGILCTQMEAQGFRRVTYFPDRPDVMSRFTCRISAERSRYPVLLCNGNLVESGSEDGGRHYAMWKDPFPKPCYLFALVAGNLSMVEDSFTTKSGRQVAIRFYVEPGQEDSCLHAVRSLKKAMRWDEQVFGLEYDLDIYMVVAVSDFNFGAMENKGLNIFNAAYISADPKTATDQDFLSVESVIAHEYFHNWTGDRITLRDWFQLTLKEGLTVFRDQEFSSDMNSRAVKRIADAGLLKSVQFPEDAGPNAHPPRPESYLEIDNFYTSTVYNKGAEIVRMIHTLLGAEKFHEGMRKYVELFDGKAVTVEDFLQAMSSVSGFDFSRFLRWYTQAGTPALRIRGRHDAEMRCYYLDVEQSCPPTPGQPAKNCFHIPLKMALLDGSGQPLPLRLRAEEEEAAAEEIVLQIDSPRQRFTFHGIDHPPLPSLLRDFSAPVNMDFDYREEDLAFILANDTNTFCRYEAGQRLALRALINLSGCFHRNEDIAWNPAPLQPYRLLLEDSALDPAFAAEVLQPPSVSTIVEMQEEVDYDAALNARLRFMTDLSRLHKDVFYAAYMRLQEELGKEYRIDPQSIGKRRLKNLCLEYLTTADDEDGLRLLSRQFQEAGNMTDQYSAFRLLCDHKGPGRRAAVEKFSEQWRNYPLVMDKWFAAQAGSYAFEIDEIENLEKHPAFDRFNPNKLRALYRVFASNYTKFHDKSGAGYKVLADRIIHIDRYNSHSSAALARAFHKYKKLDANRRELMRAEMERIMSTKPISKGVLEIVAQTLGS